MSNGPEDADPSSRPAALNSGTISEIAARSTYPIASFDELVTALGGADVSFAIRGQNAQLGEVRDLVPDYYFPIGSAADLVAKMADLAVATGMDEWSLHQEWEQRVDSPEEYPAASDCWS